MEPSIPLNTQPPAPKPNKKVLWAVFGPLLGIFLLFAGMFSYYFVVERFGDSQTREELAKAFSEQLSLVPGAARTQRAQPGVPLEKVIRSHNPQFGNASAEVTIVAFIDFECPFCRAAFSDFEQIRDQFGPAVRIVFKHFPIASIHPRATNASLAAQCAHDQGAFWEYYRALFEEQRLDDGSLVGYARALGMNSEAFEQCLGRQLHAGNITQDLQDGIDVGVRGTPTYILNDELVLGVTTFETWNAKIIEHLQSVN